VETSDSSGQEQIDRISALASESAWRLSLQHEWERTLRCALTSNLYLPSNAFSLKHCGTKAVGQSPQLFFFEVSPF